MKSIIPLFCCLWLSVSSAATTPASLKISQARLLVPTLSVYLDVRDSDGRHLPSVDAEALHATVDNVALKIEAVRSLEQMDEGMAYIFLIGVSRSLETRQFEKTREILLHWISETGSLDRIAIISFSNPVNLVSDFTNDYSQLKTTVQSLQTQGSQNLLHEGLLQAMKLARRADASLPGRRVIIVLTDGIDDSVDGPTQDMVMRQIESDHTPIYALVLKPAQTTQRHELGINALKLFAQASGGDYLKVGEQFLELLDAGLRHNMHATPVALLNCQACPADGSLLHLQISLNQGNSVLSDEMDLRALPPPAVLPPSTTPGVWPSKEAQIDIRNPSWSTGFWVVIVLMLAATAYLWRDELQRRAPRMPQNGRRPSTGQSQTHLPTAPHLMRVRLTILNQGGAGESHDLDFTEQAVIGRGAGLALSIPDDPDIAIHHCVLIRQDSALVILDLDSSGGTLVNGVPIEGCHHLVYGDVIGLGQTKLRVLF